MRPRANWEGTRSSIYVHCPNVVFSCGCGVVLDTIDYSCRSNRVRCILSL